MNDENEVSELISETKTLVEFWEKYQTLPLNNFIKEILGGCGKTTYLIKKNSLSLILQFRPNYSFHEPVAEANRIWVENYLPVAKLLSSGNIVGFKYYIFSCVQGIIAPKYLQQITNEKKMETLNKIGIAFASLCEIPSSSFGCFSHDLIGDEVTWKNYILNKFNESIKQALNKKLISINLAKKLDFQNKKLDEATLDCENPKLLYVDVNLANVIIEDSTSLPIIIDYDYLISGDPNWVLSRLSVLYNERKDYKLITTSFQKALNLDESNQHNNFRIIHALELLLLPIGHGAQTKKRINYLLEVIKTELK